ncbi:MAG: short-chain dehydrogenase [Legionella sp.]|nr:MAG: short-chain dehydrogenase [Legionella sp.]PJD97158.1 MAG: short-chain dehydrogenase [Legionella sp.]
MLKKIVVLGATSAIAEHCMRLWLQKTPAHLILVGRCEEKLGLIAADLRIRSPASLIEIQPMDLLAMSLIKPSVERWVDSGPIDLVLIAYGFLPCQKNCQQDIPSNYQALLVNGLSPVLWAEALAASMQQSKQGTLAVISSVAGDRGRKSNYSYGAAKGLVNVYLQGLQHRFASTPIQITLIKPGPTCTPMTAHLKEKNHSLAAVQQVAQCIVDGIEKKKQVIYAPRSWAVIMWIIRRLPQWVFNQLAI